MLAMPGACPQEAYNAIRLFIAGYVWMTGFGNFSYYYKTADYSIGRWVGGWAGGLVAGRVGEPGARPRVKGARQTVVLGWHLGVAIGGRRDKRVGFGSPVHVPWCPGAVAVQMVCMLRRA